MKIVKKILYLSILLIPLFLIVGLGVSVLLGINRIRNINYSKLQSSLANYLAKNKGKVLAHIEDNTMYLNYEYYINNGPYKPKMREFNLETSNNSYLIYAYGPSFLSSKPPFFKGKFPFFPSVLEEKLENAYKRDFAVVNFGMEGLDSFDIKKIISATVEQKKPDLIIYYDVSASDFECAYFSCIKKNYYLVSDFIKRLSGLFILKKPPQIGNVNKVADWYLRSWLEPNLINLAQKFELIIIPQEPFEIYNEIIFSYYIKNIYEIIEFTRLRNIPLIIITSLSNLELRPFGIYHITDKYYKMGMKEKDYIKRIEILRCAYDTEIFSGELVTKSYVPIFLRRLHKENVYVFDLQKKLQDIRFEFNSKNFYDYGHMNPYSHYLIAEYLYQFIDTHEDISSHFKLR